MMTWVGLASEGLPCGSWAAPCLPGYLLCASPACPTCPDHAIHLTSSAWESWISLQLSSPDPSSSSCHTHLRRIPWGWDTSSWSWIARETPPFVVREGAGARPGYLRFPPVPPSASALCLTLWVCSWRVFPLGCLWKIWACPPLAPPHPRHSFPTTGFRNEPAELFRRGYRPLFNSGAPSWYLVPSPLAYLRVIPGPRPRGL